ncbi:MAG: MFS transporter [Acidimicrobiales bacterium]
MASTPESPPRPGPPPWRPGERGTVGLMTASHAVQHFYSAGLAITYPFVVADFHISYATLGLVLTVAGVTGGVLQGAAGLVRRVSARTLLGAQNVALGLLSVAGAFAPGFAAFGTARCLAAFAYWPQHPVGSAYLSERFPRRRGLVLSWHTTGGSIGTVSIPLVASALIAVWGWRTALVVLAFPMVVGGVVVGSRLPAEPHRTRLVAGDGDAPAGNDPAGNDPAGNDPAGHDPAGAGAGDVPRTSVWRVVRRRKVVAILVAATISAAGRGLGTLTAYVPAYLRTGLHLSALLVGAMFTIVVLGSVVGPVVAGHLSDRYGRRPVLLVAYLGGGAALAAFGLVGGALPALAVTGAVVGLLAYAESPLLQSLFSDATDGADARAAFGVFFAIAYGVGSLWLVVIGAIIDHAGFTWAFVAMAGSFAVAAGVVALGVPSGGDRAT